MVLRTLPRSHFDLGEIAHPLSEFDFLTEKNMICGNFELKASLPGKRYGPPCPPGECHAGNSPYGLLQQTRYDVAGMTAGTKGTEPCTFDTP
jgi:hypothetical protein